MNTFYESHSFGNSYSCFCQVEFHSLQWRVAVNIMCTAVKIQLFQLCKLQLRYIHWIDGIDGNAWHEVFKVFLSTVFAVFRARALIFFRGSRGALIQVWALIRVWALIPKSLFWLKCKIDKDTGNQLSASSKMTSSFFSSSVSSGSVGFLTFSNNLIGLSHIPSVPLNRYFYQNWTQPLQNATCYGP